MRQVDDVRRKKGDAFLFLYRGLALRASVVTVKRVLVCDTFQVFVEVEHKVQEEEDTFLYCFCCVWWFWFLTVLMPILPTYTWLRERFACG